MTEVQAIYRAHVIRQFGFEPVIHPPVAHDKSWLISAIRSSDKKRIRLVRDDESYEQWRKEFAFGDPSDLLDLWRSINRQGKNNVRRA